MAERDHAARLSTSSPSMAPVSASESGWSGSSSTNPFPHSSGGMPGTLRSPALLDDRAPDLRHSLASRSVPPMAQERLAGASRPPDRGYHGSQRAEGARGVHSSPLAGSAREMRDVVPPYRQGRDYQDSPSPYYAAAPSTARPDLLTHRPSPPSLPSLSASPSSHYHFETRSSLSSASSAYGHGGGYYHRDHHRTGHLDHRLEYLHDRDYRQHHDLVRYDGEGAEMGIGHGAGFGVDTRNRKRRGNLPKETTDKLRSWFLEHLHHPYPTEEEKQEMVRETGLLMSELFSTSLLIKKQLAKLVVGIIRPNLQLVHQRPPTAAAVHDEQRKERVIWRKRQCRGRRKQKHYGRQDRHFSGRRRGRQQRNGRPRPAPPVISRDIWNIWIRARCNC